MPLPQPDRLLGTAPSSLGRAWMFLLGVALALPSSASLAFRIPLQVAEPIGLARHSEPVTSGIPFPAGMLQTNGTLGLTDESGRSVLLQWQPTATWPDGSVKWALLDFQASVGAGQIRTFYLAPNDARPVLGEPVAIRLQSEPEAIWIDTGPLRFSIAKAQFGIFDSARHDANGDRVFEEAEEIVTRGLRQSLALGREFVSVQPRVLPPESVTVEEAGPLRAVVRVAGCIDDGRTNKLVQYLARVQAVAGSAQVQVALTVIQMHPQIKMLWVKDYSATVQPRLAPATGRFLIAGQKEPYSDGFSNGPITLAQVKESQYQVVQGSQTNHGVRAGGWTLVKDGTRGLLVGSRFFWQEFPKAISVTESGIRFGLYPAEEPEPWDMDQGLAKTHELLFAFDARLSESAAADRMRAFRHPLFAIASAQWYCDSKAFGEVAPFNFDLFPDYETLTEASGDKFIKSLATGLRNWGDVYYGGPYKGKNSYMNLEYDVPHNFLVQFARTTQRKYLDTARIMAQHQADIDVNHFTRWQWKHSPRHVEIQAEFGHTFTRGLLENYFLTGNRRCREAALELGDYFAKAIRNPRELGNERQIGWSLISLLPVYEATWDRKYFEAARETVDRLISGLDARGKFNIRWDNRIAFFNGIAATGFIYFHRATGDERVAEAALRVIRRTKGMYPEYAGRTLEALAWAYQQTGDEEYLDLLKLTWEATLAKVISWNYMDLGAPTIFTVHALPFLVRSGVIGAPVEPLGLLPEQFASENGLFAHHVPSGRGELYFKNDGEPFRIVLVRKGAWKGAGEALLFGPRGDLVQRLNFPAERVLWQRQVFQVPAAAKGGAYRLRLESPRLTNVKGGSFITWDVVSSRAVPAVMHIPDFDGLQLVTPRLVTAPQGDRRRIEMELVGEGEGFKKAVLYNPAGEAAATLEAFVDLGDTGRYVYKLAADIPSDQLDDLWSLSLQDVSLSKLSGLSPYFATSPAGFFRPDQP